MGLDDILRQLEKFVNNEENIPYLIDYGKANPETCVNSKLGIIDSQTLLFEKKFLEEAILPYMIKNHDNICYGIIDIDNFKQFNDTYGHGIGDKVISHVSQILRTNLKSKDCIGGRIGQGEEFGIILADTNLEGSYKALDRIRQLIDQTLMGKYHVSVSGGLAEYRDDLSLLKKEADDSLYLAKKNGKNQVRYKKNE